MTPLENLPSEISKGLDLGRAGLVAPTSSPPIATPTVNLIFLADQE